MSAKKYKVVFLGDESAGKTSLVKRYVYGVFEEDVQATIGMDFQSKTVVLDDGRSVRLQLWDTAGQERFRSLIPSYIRDAAAAAVVYDITKKKSFESSRKWIDEVRQQRGEDAVMILIGNKCDLDDDREVSTSDGEKLATELGVMFQEVSAKEGKNVPDLFKKVAAALPLPRPRLHSSSRPVYNRSIMMVTMEKAIIANKKKVFCFGRSIKHETRPLHGKPTSHKYCSGIQLKK